MSNWYYYDSEGQKQGPCSGGQLRQLLRQGSIEPETVLENVEGKVLLAKNVKGLNFSKSETTEINPFTAPMPEEANPFTAPMPGRQTSPSPEPVSVPPSVSRVSRTKAKGLLRIVLGSVVLISLVLLGGLIAWKAMGGRPIFQALQAGLENEILAKNSLQITGISVDWTERKADSAAGKFTVKTTATEKLYKAVEEETALQKLGIDGLYENEYDAAMAKYALLPETMKNDLGIHVPQDEFFVYRFCDVLVPKGGEVTLSGSVELTKLGSNEWQATRFLLHPFSCGDDFTPESRLRNDFTAEPRVRRDSPPDRRSRRDSTPEPRRRGKEYKLDDPETKTILSSVVQARRTFVAQVEQAEEKWNEKQRQEAAARQQEQERQRKLEEQAELERKREAEMEQERLQEAALKEQIENFNAFCKPGMRYTGPEARAAAAKNPGDFDVVFKEYAGENTTTINGTISIAHPGGVVERPFSVAINTVEVIEYPVTGKIDNANLPDRDQFMRNIGNTDMRNAANFFNFLRNCTRIEIRFTDTMEFWLTDGTERRSLDLRAEGGKHPELKRDAPIGWEERAPREPVVEKVKSDPAHRALDLDQELRRSGFVGNYYFASNLRNFVQYGSDTLRSKLNDANSNRRNINQFDDTEIRKADADVAKAEADIKAALAEIAGKTYYKDFSYEPRNSTNHGDGTSGFRMKIDTGFRHPKLGEVTLIPGVRMTSREQGSYVPHGIELNIDGNTVGIGKLVNDKDKYNIRLWFTNLRYGNTPNVLGPDVLGDVRKIELIEAD